MKTIKKVIKEVIEFIYECDSYQLDRYKGDKEV